MPEKTVDLVTRLLALLGYLADHDDVAVTELANHFGVPEAQILKDLDLLWVTGTPGYFPDDLIDFTWDPSGSRVSLREARGLDRKIRLAPREALALAVAVQWMRELGHGESLAALESLSSKLTALVPAVVETAPAPQVRAALSAAIETEAGVVIEYVSAEDERTERVIFPDRLSTDGAAWYVEGWCALAGARRTFRLDRILALRPANPEETARAVESRSHAPAGAHESCEVTFVVDPAARYEAEDLPGATITESEEGLRVGMRVARTDWLVRLALGGAVTAINADLAAQVRTRADAALAAYSAYDIARLNGEPTGSEYK
ncbi:MAG: WYL domain-containing protein [Ruaniaceae bacterium]|nr:WYL domain-containing protein [Ruaniaceae bacterium]